MRERILRLSFICQMQLALAQVTALYRSHIISCSFKNLYRNDCYRWIVISRTFGRLMNIQIFIITCALKRSFLTGDLHETQSHDICIYI